MRTYSTMEELPLALRADDVASVLGISRSNAYTLMHSEGFPTVHIGKRMITPRQQFIDWIDQQASA